MAGQNRRSGKVFGDTSGSQFVTDPELKIKESNPIFIFCDKKGSHFSGHLKSESTFRFASHMTVQSLSIYRSVICIFESV